ncbi:MAG: hypothetical protein KME29_14065 [Calothrix sp. FI2-JRJ7]|jgi:hypothetical protein|nr:hypothetical protein [Calothrix sp. FI2-JRJ7]
MAQIPVPFQPLAPKNTNQPVPPPPPTPTPTESDDSGIEVIEDEEAPKPSTPVSNNPDTQVPSKQAPETETSETTEDTETPDQETTNAEEDANLPKTPQNPFERPNIDSLIQRQFNDDMWRIMRGQLPCLETSASCLQQLQEKATGASPLLKELDARIEEANNKIASAQANNKKSVRMAVLSPALQYLLGPTVTPGQPQRAGTGLIDNVLGVIRGDVGLINGLLRVIGVPLFEGTQGGNADAQRNAIAIGDLQIKVAELQRGRAKLADEIREKVALSLVKFDEARTDFQTSQVIGARAIDQYKVYELRYVRGNSDTEGYLAQQSRLDREKASVYSSWAKMRRSLFELKLLVLSVKEAEI